MTSKEALREMWVFALNPYISAKQPRDQYLYDIIERDLQVLKIIKKHEPSFYRLGMCSSAKHYNQIYEDGNFLHKRILTDDEFKLLKEWYNEAEMVI